MLFLVGCTTGNINTTVFQDDGILIDEVVESVLDVVEDVVEDIEPAEIKALVEDIPVKREVKKKVISEPIIDIVEEIVEKSMSETIPVVNFVPEPEPVLDLAPKSTYSCSIKKTCGTMSSCEEAYFYLNTCGDSKRDGAGDGVPCESLCGGG